MGAGGDFGDDSAIGGVKVDLRDDDVAEDFGAVFYYRGSGLVAGSFDAQYFHFYMIAVLTFFSRCDRMGV